MCTLFHWYFISPYLEFQRRQSELYCNQFTLIVFIQVNSRPTISLYNLAVPFYLLAQAHWYFTTSNIISFHWLTEYKQGATTASKIFHEYKEYVKFQYECLPS